MGVEGPMSNIRLPLVGLSIALLTAACVGVGSSPGPPTPAPTGSQTDGPPASASASPGPSAIEHPTGATDLILSYEVGGGLVPFGYFVTQAPSFVLYGDGTVVLRDSTATPPPAEGSISRMIPFRTARLSEAKVQELLAFALGEGGLAAAGDSYPYDMVADAPTTIFEIHAGGVDKTVSVYALGIDGPDVPDATARRAFAVLAEVLRAFDPGDAAAAPYRAERYRGVLSESYGQATAPIGWPWPSLTPADFSTSAGPGGSGYPSYTLSAAQVAALGLDGLEGGAQGIELRDPDGSTVRLLALRPLLPGETR
jgi:hypothetical protein